MGCRAALLRLGLNKEFFCLFSGFYSTGVLTSADIYIRKEGDTYDIFFITAWCLFCRFLGCRIFTINFYKI